MTILTAYLPLAYSGDGITNSFPITFPFQSSIQIVVATKVVATGIVTPLVYGTNYTVSPDINSPASTGTVTTIVVVPVGTDILISRSTPDTQDTRWVPNDPNPSTATENAVDKLTMIAQEQEYQIQNIPGGGGSTAIVTTAVFAMAAVASSQSVTVNVTTGLAVGNNVQISNAVNTLVGQITAIAASILTVKTLAIVAGSVGNSMPIGSPVQLASVPASGTNIQMTDAAIAPSTVAQQTLLGSLAGFNSATSNGFRNVVTLTITDLTATNATLQGYISNLQIVPPFMNNNVGGPAMSVAGYDTSGVGLFYAPNVIQHGYVLSQSASNGSLVGFYQLNAALSLLTGSVTPTLLSATNSPSDGFSPMYDLATGKFTWAAVGGGVPGGGTVGNFLRGDTTWSHVLNTSSIDGFILANAETNGTYGTIISNYNITPSPFHWNTLIGQALRTAGTWAPAAGGMMILGGATMITETGSATNYLQLETPNREALQTVGTTTSIIRAKGLRTTHGPWQFAYTIPTTTGAVALDLINGAYQRQASVTGNITYTLADTTPLPTLSGWQFASELTIEINAPGANTVTWPVTVTWANGGSAPTLNAAGINIVRLVRRQGLTQWVGYVEGGTFSLTAGIINSTTYFAATSVPVAAFVNGGTTPDATKFYRGDGTWQVPSGAIAAQNLGSTISGGPFTTLNFNSNISGTNLGGGVLRVDAAAGSSGIPSPNGFIIQWNGVQTWTGNNTLSGNNALSGVNTFQNRQLFNGTFATLGGSTINMTLNGQYPNIITADAAAIDVQVVDNYNTPPGGGGVKVASFNRICTSTMGSNNFFNGLDLYASQASGFCIGMTNIVRSRRLTGANADAWWFNSWSPDHNFSASPDAQGVTHTWTSGNVRIGEVNYGNAWQDWGLIESSLGAGGGTTCHGIDFVPDWLPGALYSGSDTSHHYNAQWAIGIGYAGPDSYAHCPQNYIGILSDENAIAPGGYCLRLTGSHGTFNGASETTNCLHAIIKAAGSTNIGIDFAGTYDDNRKLIIVPETTTGHSNQPAIQLDTGQAICFSPPTGANTGVYIMYDSLSNKLRATKNGGSSWTDIVP